MNELKAIIFDMDGVILNSEPLHEEARRIMYEKYGISPNDTFPSPVGNSACGFWNQIILQCGINADAHELEIEQYELVLKQIKENKILASNGLLEVIHWAKSENMLLAVASSSSRRLVDATLQLLGIYDYFDCIVSGDEVKQKKPAPDIYLKVLDLLGCTANEAIAIEDSASGTIASKQAGIFCYGYFNPTSGKQDLSHAGEVIDRLQQVIQK